MPAFKHLITAVSALVLASCASNQVEPHLAAGLQPAPQNALPQPSIADLRASDRPFRVGPFDRLTVDVFGKPELSGQEIQIDASGRISFPLIGTLEVAGLTPGEVSNAIADRLRGRFLRNPQVTVNLKEIVSQTITVGGEVKKPGLYPVMGRMTLLTAIASAEGWTEYSKKSEVLVLREVDGTRYAGVYDVKAIQKRTYDDPEIFPGDVVMVGESQGTKIWKDLLGASPLIAPFIYIIGRN